MTLVEEPKNCFSCGHNIKEHKTVIYSPATEQEIKDGNMPYKSLGIECECGCHVHAMILVYGNQHGLPKDRKWYTEEVKLDGKTKTNQKEKESK